MSPIVAFVAFYADGEEWFVEDSSLLEDGDGNAAVLKAARALQRTGQLPPGQILKVGLMKK
jgi:hypothetical protein